MPTKKRLAKSSAAMPKPPPYQPPAGQLSGFPIVAIGASAGGLAAFEAFFRAMPAHFEPGMAFVLVQHLAPDHKSILAELIRNYTRMQVFEVEDGMTIQPNCAYIILPNCDMALLNGTLQLLKPTVARGHRTPIDFFFRSLALDMHNRGIGIVLSGTGSDGTLGIRAIKAEGGLVIAQSLATAEYDGMPRSAIATGLVDYELPPEEIPGQLIAYVTRGFEKLPLSIAFQSPTEANAIKKIFILLRSQTGHDFSLYKPNSIHRRIERRMAIQQVESVEDYVKYLQQNSAEVESLFRDMLIGVTNFFRDPDAFQALEDQVIPMLFADKHTGDVIRVWSVGCSTGEEAYSIAILLAERQAAMKKSYAVQVFATDINTISIASARAGVFPASIASDISPERLARFFTLEQEGSVYRIHKSIRDMLIFSEHDVAKDTPFSRLDLISCRNLMIYLNAELQKKVISLFHYALNPDGFLFLGSSETVNELSDLFSIHDRKLKLYQRKDRLNLKHRSSPMQYLPLMTALEATMPQPISKLPAAGKVPLRELTEQTLLQQIAPAAALVNKQGDIFYLHGRTGMYLEPSAGESGINNILKMARQGLQSDLTIALHMASSTDQIIHCPALNVKTNGGFTPVNLTIRPVNTESLHDLYLAVLEDTSKPLLLQSKPTEAAGIIPYSQTGTNTDGIIAALKKELLAKEAFLHVTNEELNTSNEELRASNEEMQSVNEELQSTNEELETSKEELQSTNEELGTINAELQTKLVELSCINNDMNNLLAGTQIGTVFVDHQLCILRFTPTATAIINLIQSDIGRPVNHILSNPIGYDRLHEDLQEVLDNLIPKQLEVQAKSGKWYSMRIQPYRTLESIIEGAVVTFVDISEVVRTREALQQSETFNHLVLDSLLEEIVVLDQQGVIVAAKKAWQRQFGRSNFPKLETVIGTNYFGLRGNAGGHFGVDAASSAGILSVLSSEQTQFQFEYPFHINGEENWFLLNACSLPGSTPGVVISFHNITERKKAAEALRKANHLTRLAVTVRDANDAITVQDLTGRTIAWNPAAVRIYGWSEADALTMNVADRIPKTLQENSLAKIKQLSEAKILVPYQTQRIAKNGVVLNVSIVSTALVNEAGEVYGISITERLGGA